MLTRFRNYLAAKLSVPAGTTPEAPRLATHKTVAGISLLALDNIRAAMRQDTDAPVAQWKRPDLPPGVIPNDRKRSGSAPVTFAMDEVQDLAMDSGASTPFTWLSQYVQYGCTLTFQGYPYLANLMQISEYRAPAEVISTEMTRKWLKLVNHGKGEAGDKLDQMDKRMVELKVRDGFRRAAWLDSGFGRAQMYIEIKGQESDEARQLPLMIDDEGGIAKGSLKSLTVIEPYWTTPFSYNAGQPEKADFYVPQSWYVMGRKTHTTRLLPFISREVPDLLKPAYNFGGISMTQLMEPYVNMWLRTRKSVNDLINIFSIVTLATDMDATLRGTDKSGNDTLKRMQMFNLFRDNRGAMLINKDTEELTLQNVPLSGLDKLQAQAQEHMAAPCHIPLVKLFGAVPTGLNATSEGEIQVWYDYIRALQENLFGPQMDIVIKAIQLDLFGSVDDNIGYEWVALDEPTAKEKAEERKSDADRDTAYINAGVVSPDEVREKLQLDPTSGYDNLEGDAPEPPAQLDEFGNPVEGLPGEGAGNENGDTDEAAPDLSGFSMDAAKFEEGKHPRGQGGQFGSGGAGVTVNVGTPSGESENREEAPKNKQHYEATKAAPAAPPAPGQSLRSAQGGASKAPFVNEFMSEHKNREDDISRLGKLPDATLKKALQLLTDNRVNDEDAKYMKELLREVLKSSK